MHRHIRYPVETTTIGVWIFLILFTPKMLIITIIARRTNAADSMSIDTPSRSSITHRYALKPIRANADFSMKLAHRPSPAIVPISGPKVLSTYT